MKIVVATGNTGKVKEIKKIFSSDDFIITSMKEEGINIDVEENGTTFLENALIKAREIKKHCKFAVLSDDSGLCVEALEGRPGIYSARYAGKGASDSQRIEKLLSELSGIDDRRAKFVCSVALILPDGQEFNATGEVFGKIALSPDGDSGFGYDPVFISDELGKTFAKATEDEKNAISHRARALSKLYETLKENKII